ncbi:MAG: serine/threonine-protein kinase [Candidatus Solibacter usitatus]|nr:serine/threonine-protein kinase [Candidatus Solibacter usitatus]
MNLGDTLGPYEIVSLLGEGGMGSVYKARDPRLGRFVAVKVARAQFSERFTREARAIASLNHPNICTLHDVGPNYLVMELIEGPTLAGRIQQGKFKLDDALPILRQMADAIETAHEKNITHRDLKPDNIKITPQGVVKVLDFGLAKAMEAPALSDDPANATTLLMKATAVGVIMGTPAYMSPEQATAQPADKRCDIWAFGVIALEMFTGQQLFGGETLTHTLAEVLAKEFDVGGAPPELQPLLKRCLTRDVSLRLRDMGEARIALRDPLVKPDPFTMQGKPRRRWAIPALAAMSLVAAALGGGWWMSTRPVEKPLVWVDALPAGAPTAIDNPAISRDASRIAFLQRNKDGRTQLAVRNLNQDKAVSLSGTEEASFPFFSPDGNWIGYFTRTKLRKVSVDGGPSIDLCDAPQGRGGSWGQDGFIVAGLNSRSPLARVPASGGSPVPVTKLENGERSHRYPHLLPDGKGVLFMSVGAGIDYETSRIDLYVFENRRRVPIHQNGRYPRFLSNGYVTYVSQGTLFALPFSIARMQATGEPSPVLSKVLTGGPGSSEIDLSPDGTVFFLQGQAASIMRSPAWVDAKGNLEILPSETAMEIHLSPDGRMISFHKEEGSGGTIWIYDIARGTSTKVTFANSHGGVWSADSKGVFFHDDAGDLYWVRADGGAKAHKVLQTSEKNGINALSASRDSRSLLCVRSVRGQLFVLALEPGAENGAPRAGKEVPFGDALSFGEVVKASFSPDGKWVAYPSDESGRNQVYVRAYPDRGNKWLISATGGTAPAWSPNGKELFYVGQDDRIQVVDYAVKGDAFQAGKPREWAPVEVSQFRRTLSVSPDGKRILAIPRAAQEANQDRKPVLLFNFNDEVRRKMRRGQ